MTQQFQDNTAFIPEVYAKKLARVAKQFSKFIERNCNREWEGEIRNFGDVVRIALPDPSSINIAFGNENSEDRAAKICPVKNATKSREKTLVINKTATFALEFNDIDTAQSQFDLLNGYGALAMQQLGDGKDKQVMKAVVDAAINGLADTDEDGAATGTVEKANTIGTTAAPEAVTKDNIYDVVVDMGVALQNAGYLNADGFYSFKGNQEETEYLQAVLTVTPAIYGLMLKSTQLTHPTAAGDQVIERGKKGMMGGFEIDVNTVLNTVATETYEDATDKHIMIAATKMAVTYANQITKVEKLRDPECFADIVRGLELYGYKVIHPKAACVAFVTTAA